VTTLAPIVEEMTFRGLGVTLFLRFGRWAAILATGIWFALVHGLVEGFPILAAFGVALAYLRTQTRSIYPAILLHAAFNGFALGAGLLV
jgi:membrane protease YdiL (CAAX protease family)